MQKSIDSLALECYLSLAMNEIITLKNRMKLKRLEIKAQKACDENFGYCPNYPWFHELLEKLNEVRTEVQQHDQEWFKNVYEPTEYKDSVTCLKKMQIF